MQMTATDRAKKNDAMRQRLPATKGRDKFVVTSSVAFMGPETIAKAIKTVRDFADFSEANDPYGEHDFGSFELDGEKFFWKIDYYDGQEGIDNLLTLMLASDY